MNSPKMKKVKDRLGRGLLTRTFFFVVLVLLQIALVLTLTWQMGEYFSGFYLGLTILSVLVVLGILEKDGINPMYKLMWVIIIMALPPTGTLFYLFWGHRGTRNRHAIKTAEIQNRISGTLPHDPHALQHLKIMDKHLYRSAKYLENNAKAPIYADTQSEYYAWGEDFFPRFLEEIEKAQRFIFMEYFIIRPGIMWDTTVEVLKRKAAQGLDVRVMYDAFGSMLTLPESYHNDMVDAGIEVVRFGKPKLSLALSDYTMLNHRDHRKITVVDGNVGFTGGLNFADEYINKQERFGLWKDTGFMLRGSGVASLTALFLEGWDFATGAESNLADYSPTLRYAADGLVQPYGDNPLDEENVSENAYFNVLQRASDYVYIATPYLVVDNEMITTLSLIAKSGVDVRIITPGIPDKWYVYLVTQSYYPVLLKAGVRIFEYTPGFIHAKMYASDDKTAIVGSANMDYRSLYLHFENCCSFYGGQMVRDVKNDLVSCMEVSNEVTFEQALATPLHKRLLQSVLRLFAPML